MDGGCAEEEEEGAEGCFHGDRGSPAPSQEVAHHFLSDATEGEVWKERGLLPRGPQTGCNATLSLDCDCRRCCVHPRGGHCANRRYRH